MQNTRTDLAEESFSREHALPDGVQQQHYERRCYPITDTEIQTTVASQLLCKPIGRYITLDAERFFRREENAFADGVAVLGELIRRLLPLEETESVLVAGLGNRAITPDAVGPETVSMTLVTRHLVKSLPVQFGHLRPVCAVATGVLGTTGLESADLIRALFDTARPDAVIAVDALAAQQRERLCRTVQLTDSGITPGSGVGNARQELSARVLGVPVLAIGVPTVVDAGDGLILTRRDIDKCVRDLGRLLGYGINCALQKDMTCADIDMLIG